ncbi:hypothetical protein BV20DRAFT_954821 [Pilatotrama ljubarskyi]|nr:hypothetical protein BV20DRAFT_954821 [Pilatotrama ljubarskyi]
MSLDQNLFTLNVTPRPDDRNVLDLIDTNGVVHYTKRRLPGTEYTIEVIDPLSESVLATVTAPSPMSKHKTLQLYNPDIIVELKYTGTLSFKWGFRWEEHDFEWKREECYILRKPDPAVLVAITKEPPGRLQTRSVQILDYNLNRFDINDRKGLEIVILTALLTFQDLNESYHTPRTEASPSLAASPSESSTTLAAVPVTTGLAGRLGLSRQPSQVLSTPPPPAVPPKPAPRTGVDRVAEIHAVRAAQGEGDANEIEVEEECSVDDYAQYAERLLNDEAMLFVTVRSATAAQVPKVLRVVEETKRLRHKSGVAEDEELHQYVIYDTQQGSPKAKGPKRINLDDPDPKNKGKDKAKYAPPTSLTVHLSKIDMPELQPKASSSGVRRPSGSRPAVGAESAPEPMPEMSDRERKKAEKESKKAGKEGKEGKKSRKKEKGQCGVSLTMEEAVSYPTLGHRFPAEPSSREAHEAYFRTTVSRRAFPTRSSSTRTILLRVPRTPTADAPVPTLALALPTEQPDDIHRPAPASCRWCGFGGARAHGVPRAIVLRLGGGIRVQCDAVVEHESESEAGRGRLSP